MSQFVSTRRRPLRVLIEGLEFRQLLSASPITDHWNPGENLPAARLDLSVLPAVTNTTPTGLTPSQVRHAYNFDNVFFSGGTVSGNGAGQTVAIVDAYDHPSIASDLKTFDAAFGLSNPALSVVKMARHISTNAGWALETSLDVEWAHAIAPAAKIVLVEARSAGLSDLLSAVDTARKTAGVSVVSMSWGAGEFSSETSYDSYFTTPAGHGNVSCVASSGDSGAPAMWPAASPNVLAVGGTNLQVDSSGNYLSESGWSGSTGGISGYERKPSYQSNVTQSATYRTVPDVAYDADPNTGFAVYDSVSYSGQSGWFQVGGTSAGAPQWAALVAIADQGRATAGKGTLDTRSQLLPALYTMSTSNFHDITSGTSTGSPYYSASSAYDLVTGIGTPHADSVVQQLLQTT